jgi:hypothetical protein
MPIQSTTLKHDSRSVRQLAQAILDHEFTPRESDCPYDCSMTFREQLLYAFGTDEEMPYSRQVLWPLKALADGIALDRQRKHDLSHALQVIAAYRQDSTELLGIAAYEEAATSQAEISNLASIETLARVLALKLNITLVEPT